MDETFDDASDEWTETMERGREILPLFEDCRLGLLVSDAARSLGLRDRDDLHKMLANRRLPPFKSFRNWYYVVWLADHFANGNALADWALRRGESPSAYYELVKQTTGRTWTEVKANGATWVRTMALGVWRPFLPS